MAGADPKAPPARTERRSHGGAKVGAARGHSDVDTELLRRQVQHFIRRFGVLAEERTPCGAPISPREAHALMVIGDREKAREAPCQNDIARELGIDKSNITRLVQRLRDAGHVSQVASDRDGRTRILQLTPKGRRLTETIEQLSRRRFQQLLDGVPRTDRTTIIRGLSLLNEVLGRDAMEVAGNGEG